MEDEMAKISALLPYLEGFCWGLVGGILVETLFWWRIRDLDGPDRPTYTDSMYYWIPTLVMIFAGGIIVMAHLRSGSTLTAFASLNLGASAPLVISAASKSLPEFSPGRIDSDEIHSESGFSTSHDDSKQTLLIRNSEESKGNEFVDK